MQQFKKCSLEIMHWLFSRTSRIQFTAIYIIHSVTHATTMTSIIPTPVNFALCPSLYLRVTERVLHFYSPCVATCRFSVFCYLLIN